MENSAIAWCDDTFNSWVGCMKVSAGCRDCYAETLMKRYGRDVWGPGPKRERTSEANWKKPILWNKQAQAGGQRRLVFCGSLMDVFEDNPQLVDWRVDLFRLIEKTPALTWLLLTKRPENIIQMTVWGAPGCRMPKNVWIGTTVENQDVAQKRLDHLIEVPADVHFISVEPQIGPVSISRWLGYEPDLEPSHGVDWVIVGGESGATCRPFQVEWARSLLKQCRENNIAFFMKQLGGYPNKRHDLSDFPDDLKIREFPR